MSFLMPTAVRPALGVCGTYLAVGSSNADKALSGITQVLHTESMTGSQFGVSRSLTR